MKKTRLKFAVLLLSGFSFVACDKDDEVKPSTNEPEFPTSFSKLTVEQNKAKLEDNGIELVNNVKVLKNTSGIKTAISFNHYLDEGTLPENLEGGRVKTNSGVTLMRKLANFGAGKTSVAKTLSGLRISEEEFESFQQFYTDLVGVYAYNRTKNEWAYTETGNKIVFQFPSTKTGTTNDAEFSIYDYTGVKINSEIGGDDYNGDYPTGLKAELKVGGATKILYTFSASYNSAGDPASVGITVTIDDFKFSYEISNSTKEAKMDYALTKGETNLFSYGVRANGNFSAGTPIEDVLTSSTAYFQIVDIKFSGEVKYKELRDALELAETAQQTADAWNENYKLIVFYADTKEKIADSEFYITTETYMEEQCDWDPEEGLICEDVEVTKENTEVRLVFADETKADLETYTDAGFEDVREQLENLADDFKTDLE